MGTALTAEQRRWRARIFFTTWLAYVGYYFCRTPFNATKALIGKETGWSATQLGDIGAVYLFTYAVGQFLASQMGTRLGPRKNVLIGMTVSIVATLAMGIALDRYVLMGLVGVNGLAQATGWSGNVGTMANWFHKHERGRVMGLWSTNFNIGSIASQYAMAGVLALPLAWGVNWRWCFYAGGLFLIGVAIQFYFLQRNTPEDVGLAAIDDPQTAVDESKTPEPPASSLPMGLSRDAWINLFLVGCFYFFVKFVRYAVWGWAAFFLVQNYKVSGSASNLYATAFSVVGMPGIYFTGYLSDRYFDARRAGISTIMMIGMMGATGLLIILANAGVIAFTVCLALVGFTLFGPDALLTGAGAIDIGGRRAATFAAAFISGLGSTGAIVQELVIGRLYDAKKGDVTAIFVLLFTAAALATFFCVILVLRNRRGGKGI